MKHHQEFFDIHRQDKKWQRFFYALPFGSMMPLILPILIVQGIYAKYHNLSLSTIAAVILFVRMFDAITDPVIGYLSDQYRLKHGTRKPYMIVGALLTLGSGYCLYNPPETVSVLYFALWFTLVFVGFTLFGIPHMAWGGEISHDTHEKTQTYNLRTAAAYTGIVVFYCIPLLPVWETREITPETLKFSAIVSILFTLPLLYLCMKRVPDGSCYDRELPGDHENNRLPPSRLKSIMRTLSSIVHNRPLLLFLGAFVFSGASLGMWYGLIFIFVDAYLGKGNIFAELNLIVFLIGVLSSFMWVRLARTIGKKNTWLVAMGLGAVAFVYTGFFHPENASYLSLLLLLTINILCFICIESLPQSMLSDIVDYATLKSRLYRGSTYFSLYLFFYKGANAAGAALGLAVAGWYGFDPAVAHHTERGISGLMLAMTWVPASLAIIAMVFIYLSPITVHRHRIIRRRLESLEARSKKKNSSISVGPGILDIVPAKPNYER